MSKTPVSYLSTIGKSQQLLASEFSAHLPLNSNNDHLELHTIKNTSVLIKFTTYEPVPTELIIGAGGAFLFLFEDIFELNISPAKSFTNSPFPCSPASSSTLRSSFADLLTSNCKRKEKYQHNVIFPSFKMAFHSFLSALQDLLYFFFLTNITHVIILDKIV